MQKSWKTILEFEGFDLKDFLNVRYDCIKILENDSNTTHKGDLQEWEEELEIIYGFEDNGLSLIERCLALKYPPPNFFYLIDITDDMDLMIRVWELKFSN